METTYLKRNIDLVLAEWKEEKRRKTLLLRGARQVGKSYAVRNLSKSFQYFIEVNFGCFENIEIYPLYAISNVIHTNYVQANDEL